MKKYMQPLLLAALFLLSGCNDDFLERVPQTEISRENYFNSEQDLETYMYSLYDFPGVSIYVNDASTDNSSTTGTVEIKSMMVGNPTPATITGGWDWSRLRDVNYFLGNFGKAAISQEAKDHYEGLARFFRAKFYMEKVKRYSDVPWYDQVLATNDTELLMKARDPRDFVVKKIFEDYAFAAEHVRNDNRAGAVNKAVVQSYMARHALYEGSFRKYHSELALQGSANTYFQMARDAAKKVMDSGKYTVSMTGKPTEDYASLFNNTNLEGNSEVIMGTFNEQDKLNSGWGSYMFGNYEASPARDLLQTYQMKDGSAYTSQAGYATKSFTQEFVDRDPRLAQTFAYPGWVLVNATTYSQGAGIYVQQLAKNQSGYHQLKGFVNQREVAVANSVDTPVLRYAEVLLTYAESKAELGELTQTDLDLTVNKIRSRVGMPALNLTTPVDAGLARQYPNVTGSQAGIKLELRRERRVELAMEGFRFDDLMRWNAGKLIEKEPEGLYFSGLGNYDLTGDNVPDIKLIPLTQSIPAEADKESNSLGTKLVYYRVGPVGSDASFFLTNGTSGTIVADPERGTFQEPKYYYRPVPQAQVNLNANLKQIMGW